MTEKLLRMCAWCKKINLDNQWVGEEYPNYEYVVASYSHKITHGTCPEDLEKMIESIPKD